MNNSAAERWIADLAEQQRRIDEMQSYVAGMVSQAKIAGASWSQIGGALGMTKQSAHEKYAPIVAEPFKD